MAEAEAQANQAIDWEAMDGVIAGAEDESADNLEPATETEKLAEMDALLGVEVEEVDEQEEAGPDDTELPEPGEEQGEGDETEQEAAPDDGIDYDQDIPMRDGLDPVKLGDLKDAYINSERTERRQEERSNELMVKADDLAELLGTLGELPQGTQEFIDQRKQQRLATETAAMFEAIPEWDDQAVFTTDRKEMQDLAARFGYSEQEFKSETDHRMVKMVRHFMLHERGLARSKPGTLESKSTRKKQTARRPGERRPGAKVNQSKLVDAATKSSDRGLKMRAIDSLLE